MAEIKYHGWTTNDKEITALIDEDGLSMCIEDDKNSYSFDIEYEELDVLLDFIWKYRKYRIEKK
jgi:hypothetical protein